MIRCNLAEIMKSKDVKITELANKTGVHRNTLTALQKDTAQRIELGVIKKICVYLDCSVGDLFEIIGDY